MYELLLLRHAHAEPAMAGGDDFERPLSAAGRSAALEVARQLDAQQWRPERTLYSPARRAADTAALVCDALKLDHTSRQALAPLYLAKPGVLRAQLKAHHDGAHRLMIVGHNPGLSEWGVQLSDALAGQSLATAKYWHIALDPSEWQRRVLTGRRGA